MRTVYYADDGTEFDNREECLNYERQQADALKNFKSHMYDNNGDEVFLDGIDKVGTVDYFDIKTITDLKFLRRELEENRGMSMPKYIGQWYYNYDKDCWDSYAGYKELYLIMNKIFEGK